jgi:hypothetical protein
MLGGRGDAAAAAAGAGATRAEGDVPSAAPAAEEAPAPEVSDEDIPF